MQIFNLDGTRIGDFTLPGRAVPRVTLGNMVLNGIGSLQFTGQSIVMNQPELGGLIIQCSLHGHPFQTFGVFRRTGHETNLDLHLALNSGIPLVDPGGGFYFVFQAGVPLFQKYDARGNLISNGISRGRSSTPSSPTCPRRGRVGTMRAPAASFRWFPSPSRRPPSIQPDSSGSHSPYPTCTCTIWQVRKSARFASGLRVHSSPPACSFLAPATCWSRPAATNSRLPEFGAKQRSRLTRQLHSVAGHPHTDVSERLLGGEGLNQGHRYRHS